MHTHSDIQLLANPAHEAKVFQGVTVDVIGQDGLSFAPVTDDVRDRLRVQIASWNDDPPGFDWNWHSVAEYLARFDDRVAINAAYLVPHGTLRMLAMGMDDRPPADAELAEMKRLLRTGLDEGAVGLSTGLTYAPCMFAADDELVELCSVMRETGGFYTPHHRNYGSTAIESYRDCIEIVRRAGVPLHYAHAHLGFPMNKGRAPELLAMIDAARAEGLDVTMDTYPYLAGMTALHTLCTGLGAGRRPRRRRRTVSGPVAPRAHPRRARGNGLRRPARLARRLGADGDLGRAEGAEPPVRRHDRGRGGRTGGKAADRPLLRALRRRRARCLHDHPHRQRGERPDDHDPPGPHGGQRRDSRRRAAPPARLGHVPALSGRVRARARHPLLGERDQEVHVPGGPAARHSRPRTAAAGHGGRPRLPGPRDRARHRDLRRSEALSRGDPLRGRQRPACRRRGAPHGRPAGRALRRGRVPS